jgi:hypothetical protein
MVHGGHDGTAGYEGVAVVNAMMIFNSIFPISNSTVTTVITFYSFLMS